MQQHNNSPSLLDANFIKNELNIDPEFCNEDTIPVCICGKWFRNTTTFNGDQVLTGSIKSIGVTGKCPTLPGESIFKDDFTTEIIEGDLHINHADKRWAYSTYNFPYVDGIHRRIRSTTLTLESHLLLEIVSAGKCLYWIVAPMEVPA